MQQIWHLVPDTSGENHNRQFKCAMPLFKHYQHFTSMSAFSLNPFIERSYAYRSFFIANPMNSASLACLSEFLPHAHFLSLIDSRGNEEMKTHAARIRKKSQVTFSLNMHQDADFTEVKKTSDLEFKLACFSKCTFTQLIFRA